MIAIIFEVWPRSGHEADYFAAAGELREALQAMPGFISVERFRSVADEGKILSLSFFESEEAVKAWRNTVGHREAQALGIGRHFRDYRIRVATVERDYGLHRREEAPGDSREVHEQGGCRGCPVTSPNSPQE